MRQTFAALALAATLPFALTAPAHAADVGVSVQISQPGVYGRIDIGRYPQPALIVREPVYVARPVVVAPIEPLYLWVPPGHRKHWAKHCAQYGACGHPVYFVQDRWYQDHVVRGRGEHGDRGERGERGERGDRGERGHGDRGRGHGHKD